MATIQSISSVSCVSSRLLSSQDLQSAVRPLAAAIQSRFSVSCVASSGCYPIETFSHLCGLLAAIQSRSSVSCVAFSGGYPFEIFSRLSGIWQLLSSLDLQSAVWPQTAAIRSRSSSKPIFKGTVMLVLLTRSNHYKITSKGHTNSSRNCKIKQMNSKISKTMVKTNPKRRRTSFLSNSS